MTLLGSLIEQWLRVTERNGGGIKVTTLEDLYQEWWFSHGYANKIPSPSPYQPEFSSPSPRPHAIRVELSTTGRQKRLDAQVTVPSPSSFQEMLIVNKDSRAVMICKQPQLNS